MAKYTKKISLGNWLKKGTDFKEGEMLEVLNEGKEVSGEYGNQNIFLVKTEEGKEGNVSFNQTTINGLIDVFGDDSINWIGKNLKCWKIKQNVGGKFTDVWYFSHPDADLTENGFIIKGQDNNIPIVEDDI